MGGVVLIAVIVLVFVMVCLRRNRRFAWPAGTTYGAQYPPQGPYPPDAGYAPQVIPEHDQTE